MNHNVYLDLSSHILLHIIVYQQPGLYFDSYLHVCLCYGNTKYRCPRKIELRNLTFCLNRPTAIQSVRKDLIPFQLYRTVPTIFLSSSRKLFYIGQLTNLKSDWFRRISIYNYLLH